MVSKKYIYSYPGSSEFISPELAYCEVLDLKRGGMQYKEITGTPAGREFSYEYSSGRFNFDTAIFTGEVPPGRYIPEKILVIYKT